MCDSVVTGLQLLLPCRCLLSVLLAVPSCKNLARTNTQHTDIHVALLAAHKPYTASMY
jgi:hypothetical protein